MIIKWDRWQFYLKILYMDKILIYGWLFHPWMKVLDDENGCRFLLCPYPLSVILIHGWDFSNHGRHLPMTLSSMDEVPPSMDKAHIHGWDLLTYGWNCHLSGFAYVLQSFWLILAKVGKLCEQNVTEVNFIHEWTNLIHTWMKVSSMDGGTTPMDESVISGWGWLMTDMDGAYTCSHLLPMLNKVHLHSHSSLHNLMVIHYQYLKEYHQ